MLQESKGRVSQSFGELLRSGYCVCVYLQQQNHLIASCMEDVWNVRRCTTSYHGTEKTDGEQKEKLFFRPDLAHCHGSDHPSLTTSISRFIDALTLTGNVRGRLARCLFKRSYIYWRTGDFCSEGFLRGQHCKDKESIDKKKKYSWDFFQQGYYDA